MEKSYITTIKIKHIQNRIYRRREEIQFLKAALKKHEEMIIEEEKELEKLRNDNLE